MGVIEIVIIIAAVLIVGLVIGVSIWKKATGRKSDCGCGGNCSGCRGCGEKKTHGKSKRV